MLRAVLQSAVAGLWFATAVVWAEEPIVVGDVQTLDSKVVHLAGGTPEVGEDGIAELVRQLDQPHFVARQAATDQLLEAGLAALPRLERAASRGSREASTRALDILKRHFERGRTEAGREALAALERLAMSQDPSLAQRARNILSPPPVASLSSPIAWQQPGMLPLQQANIQIQLGLGIGGRRVQVREANGRREVEAEDNNRRVKMLTLPNGSIEVQIAEKQNGFERTRTVEARSVDDLKRKDAQAGQLYEQFSEATMQFGGAAPAAPRWAR